MPLLRNVKRFNTQKLEKIAFGVHDAGFLCPCFTVAKAKRRKSMKTSTIFKITIICFLLFGLSLSGNHLLWGAVQLVEVSLKDGSSVTFEYQSFMAGNFKFPERLNQVTAGGEAKTFGEKRFMLTHQANCREESISLDNLVEIEVLGRELNNCSGKKDWLLKVYLFDQEKYKGFLSAPSHNADRMLSEHNLRGILADAGNERLIKFEDIKKITFFAR